MKVFERPGPVNTGNVIEIAHAASSSYEYIVVASITGDSAIKLAKKVSGNKLICVTCPQGMNWEIKDMSEGPFTDIPELKQIRAKWLKQGLKSVPMQLTAMNRNKLDKSGVKIVQGTIPFFGPTFSLRVHMKKPTDLDIVAKTLELISTGTLVCLECVLMAVDAGAIPEGTKVLALAGTERGLDTAWVIRSSASANLFHPAKGAKFIELLAKPGCSLMPDIDISYIR